MPCHKTGAGPCGCTAVSQGGREKGWREGGRARTPRAFWAPSKEFEVHWNYNGKPLEDFERSDTIWLLFLKISLQLLCGEKTKNVYWTFAKRVHCRGSYQHTHTHTYTLAKSEMDKLISLSSNYFTIFISKHHVASFIYIQFIFKVLMKNKIWLNKEKRI